jgi:putative ABC transport system ATP-binding protein
MDHGKEVFACRGIDLELREGEFLGILGPSGSGKSSLLYLMSGLKTPTVGRIEYQGRPVSEMTETERAAMRMRDFGFVFQYPYLVGYLTALENVMVARPDRDVRDESLALLESLGLGSKAHRLPHELSGGERQRVCVARAIVGRPKAVFADEPTASLDHTNGTAVVDKLVESRGGGSLVVVTHDPTMLVKADRIVRIADGSLLEDA